MSNIVWSWRNAAFGAVMSTVAVIVIVTRDVENGLNLLIGAIPAAILGLPPHRKDRRKVIIIGVLFAVSVMIGSIVAQWAPVAVVGMFLMGLGAALLATRKALGYAVLTICLPLAGTGLTYEGLDESAGVFALFILGSAIAFAGALCFPEYHDPAPVEPPLLTIAAARGYGVRLGLAAAVATAIGFASGAEHTGWIVISTLIVMRPTDDMMKLRSAGRAISVFIGAIVAAWLLNQDLSPGAIASSAPARSSPHGHQRQSVVHHAGVHHVPDPVVRAVRQQHEREHHVPLHGTSRRHTGRGRHRLLLRTRRTEAQPRPFRHPLDDAIWDHMTGERDAAPAAAGRDTRVSPQEIRRGLRRVRRRRRGRRGPRGRTRRARR